MAGKTLDCGHKAVPDGFATGVATAPDGTTMCYACANAAEVARFAESMTFTGYVSGKGTTFTTWPGAALAKVTATSKSRMHWTPTGGQYRMRYVTAVSPDGRVWHGKGSDAWDVITLRTRTAPRKPEDIRAEQVAALRARRAERGDRDPLAILRAYNAAHAADAITEVRAVIPGELSRDSYPPYRRAS